MSKGRKLVRKYIYHTDHKCKCGYNLKFYKYIKLKNNVTNMTKEYNNIFWCKHCGRIYNLKNEKGENIL